MSYTLSVAPLSGPLGLYLWDFTDDGGDAHLWLETPFKVLNAGPDVNPAGVLNLKLDLFRKFTGSGNLFELVPASKNVDVPVISGPKDAVLFERLARTPDGTSIDLKEFPMRNRTIPEDYTYVLSLENAPTIRIDFQRINSGIGGIPVVSTDPPPATVAAPASTSAKTRSELGWQERG